MTEDDTFKRLKGLTYDECLEIYTLNYLSYIKDYPDCTVQDGWNHVDTILKPYGWTCRLMEKVGLEGAGLPV